MAAPTPSAPSLMPGKHSPGVRLHACVIHEYYTMEVTLCSLVRWTFFSFSIISSKYIHLNSFLEICTAFHRKLVHSPPPIFGPSPLREHSSAYQHSLPPHVHLLLRRLALSCASSLSVLASVTYSSRRLVLHLQVEGRDHVQLTFLSPASSAVPEM